MITILKALFMLAALTVAVPALGADTTPPTVTSFGFTPAVVNVAAGDTKVQFNISVADDDSGINWNSTAVVQFRSPTGTAHSSSQFIGAENSANASFTVTGLPTSKGGVSNSGTWSITRILLADKAGNVAEISREPLKKS